MTALDAWIEDEARFAAREMMRAISATDIVKNRPGFGQRVIPAPGSVLASPVPAAYDPDPDYFFHWYRDSAIVIDALRVAFAEGWLDGEAVVRFREFARFNQSLRNVDGREFLARSEFRDIVQPSYLQYLRPDAEIAAVNGDALLADVRVNADGTLDFTRWARPQNDGPPLLALALMRWQRRPELNGDLRDSLNATYRRRPRVYAFARERRLASTSGRRRAAFTISLSSFRPKRLRTASHGWRAGR